MIINIYNYLRLMRFDQPAGLFLLLAPIFCSIAFCGEHIFLNKVTVIFTLGAIIARSAGCIINDIIDLKFDRQVERTKTRALASGDVSIFEASIILIILLTIGLLLLFQLNELNIKIGFLAIILITLYPLMKRITYWPQLFLGITFNLGIIMAQIEINHAINKSSIFLYVGSIFWTLGYDTIYAYQDKKDDELIGVKSSAIALGKDGKKWINFFYRAFLIMYFFAVKFSDLSIYTYIFLVLSSIYAYWQISKFDANDPKICSKIFKSNIYLGVILILGFALGRI